MKDIPSLFWKNTHFIFLCICLNFPSVAQSVKFCSTLPPSTPEFAPHELQDSCYPEVPGPFFIRIYVHVIRATNGTGGQPPVLIEQALETMCADFTPLNISFVWENKYINTIKNDTLYTSINPALTILLDTYGNTNGINIFFFPQEEGISPLGGYASLPGKAMYIGGEFDEWDGEVYSAIESKIISHTMGHCLGLYHTFEQMPDRFPNNNIYCCDIPEGERVDGSNSCECGDYVEDTPAFFKQSNTFVSYPDCLFQTSEKDCAGDTYNPDEKLIMNHTYVPCMQYFTPGQGARMRWVIQQGGLNPDAWELTNILADIAGDPICQFSGLLPNPLNIGDHHVLVYPNPASEQVTFNLTKVSSIGDLKIFDLSGNLLWSTAFRGKTIWQTADVPSGLYFYTLASESQLVATGKISLLK